MGQDRVATPEHHVALTRYYLLGRTEATNTQFLAALNWAYTKGLVTVEGDFVRQYDQDLVRINGDGLDTYEIRFDAGTQQFQLHAATYEGGDWGPGEGYPGGDYSPGNHPVKYVSWYGAACYCDWLSLMAGLTPYYNGQWDQIPATHNPYDAIGYRLPTEAEWEYAAQFADERIYSGRPVLPWLLRQGGKHVGMDQ